MRMLEALTGPPSAVSIVTAADCSLAAWEKIAAGRAWRPLLLATFTVRAGISSAFLDGCELQGIAAGQVVETGCRLMRSGRPYSAVHLGVTRCSPCLRDA